MLNLITWIQNPEKSQKDLILYNGEFISLDDPTLRDKASRRIFETENLGKPIYMDNGLGIIRNKNNYLIKLQTTRLDDSGRSMPIMMLVENFEGNSEPELEYLIKKTLRISKYEIKSEHIKQVHSQIKKDSTSHIKKKKILKSVLIAVLLLFLISMFKLFTKE